MKKNIYVLGNPLVDKDKIPLRLLPKLRELCPQWLFLPLDPTEEVSELDEDLILVDTVIGIHKLTVYHDLRHFALSPRVTVHDYDLPINLGLMQKLGKIKNVTVIGIPNSGNMNEILMEVINFLYSHLTLRK